jgi:hypothetical protein
MNLELGLEESHVVFPIEELDAKLRSIHERAVQRGKTFLVSQAEALESIIEIDQHKLYEKFGLAFLTPYCVQYMGLDETIAGVLVRIARKSRSVPELKLAVVAGEASISNARAISSVITPENQLEWIEKAKTFSKHKLEREVATVSPAKAKPEKARYVGNGRVQIGLNLSEEEFERRSRIKELVSQNLRKTATDSEVEVAMMDCYQFHKDPVRKAERATKRKCKEGDAPRLGQSGDADIPAQVKHAVNLRDRKQCQAQMANGTICGSARWTELHHIVPRLQGGLDVSENLITLCSGHHRLWHKRASS